MAVSTKVLSENEYGDLLEKVIIGQDLSGLKPIEKVIYIKQLCKSLGLNPLTKPFEIVKFNGKEVPYARKDCTEQLRKINKVSITNLDTKILDGGVYVVAACAGTPDGRQDSSTGVVSISGLKGEALSNAMMKAETKAKRRVTLSICGLGFMDESEVESIPNAKKMDVYRIETEQDKFLEDLDEYIFKIFQSKTKTELQEVYTEAYKLFVSSRDKESLSRIISAKDKRKSELMLLDFNAEIDSSTGEVLSNEAIV